MRGQLFGSVGIPFEARSVLLEEVLHELRVSLGHHVIAKAPFVRTSWLQSELHMVDLITGTSLLFGGKSLLAP